MTATVKAEDRRTARRSTLRTDLRRRRTGIEPAWWAADNRNDDGSLTRNPLCSFDSCLPFGSVERARQDWAGADSRHHSGTAVSTDVRTVATSASTHVGEADASIHEIAKGNDCGDRAVHWSMVHGSFEETTSSSLQRPCSCEPRRWTGRPRDAGESGQWACDRRGCSRPARVPAPGVGC